MLLVTTKKSNTELAKSIDFLMENNTTVFVKWLSTIIKKLQQVTVSTTEKKISGNNLFLSVQYFKYNYLLNIKNSSYAIKYQIFTKYLL